MKLLYPEIVELLTKKINSVKVADGIISELPEETRRIFLQAALHYVDVEMVQKLGS